MKKFILKIFILVFFVLMSCSRDGQKKIFTGIVEGTTIQLPALTGGKINELLVNEGDQVQKGQIIAQVDTLELHFQKKQLEGALEELKAQEKLATTDLSRIKKDLEYIQKKYNRFFQLLKSETIDQQTIDDLSNRVQSAESAYQAARQKFQTIAAKKKQLQAQLGLILKKIADARIVAPQDGFITNIYYEEEEAVPPLNPLVEIINLDEVWVKIYVSETMLPEIKVGQKVVVRPDGSSKKLEGKISWISPKAEFTPKTILTPETRTSLVYAVKILIPNQDKILKQGMPVEIHL